MRVGHLRVDMESPVQYLPSLPPNLQVTLAITTDNRTVRKDFKEVLHSLL